MGADYDTLKMAQRLEGPFSRDQATALTEALAVSTADTVATKSDIVAVKSDIVAVRSEIAAVKSELKSDIAAVKSDLVELRAALETKITSVESNLIKWVIGALLLNFFGVAGLIISLTRALAR